MHSRAVWPVSASAAGADPTLDGETRSSGAATTPTGVPSPPVPPPRAPPPVPRRPRLVRLPIGLWVQLQPVGTSDNGLLDAPADVDSAGWWEGGSRLGDPFGTMLVAARVGSRTEGLGPFASLLTARPGERIRVWGGGMGQTYEVRTRRLRPLEEIAPTSWPRFAHGPARLTLVTPAGSYDADNGGYQNLAVIVAFPIGEVLRR